MVKSSGIGFDFAQPFLQFEKKDENGEPLYAGVLFDPFKYFAEDYELDRLKTRSVIMGFGFELIGEGKGIRQQLFNALVSWVKERIDVRLDVHTFENGYVLINTKTEWAKGVNYMFDFDNGSYVVNTKYSSMDYQFTTPAQHTIAVMATAPLGAADVDVARINVDLSDTDIDSADTDSFVDTASHQTDSDAAFFDSDSVQWEDVEDLPVARSCGCTVTGQKEAADTILSILL
jgi:hypothetical protein